ncbi:MarR family winged helix-turn-helix transcriptional regulator [Nocardia sp. alder85J]|uniref:MarR family winged helix-turn-helix transcriptional regulator n=1 Tax=Nocardia sp. alder85J TaxID=2862949 RepID=UPI001CD75EB4|nr:MarR family transcriptional regulator [Nocardia sp. alder85J]MCX4096678.1 MarR family transcriptional regulator [Nocardia sp. alder85J]
MHIHRVPDDGAPSVADGLLDDWLQLAAFVDSVDADAGKWLVTSHGISLTEYRALRNLAAAPDKELRVNVLAARIGLNQSSVTRLLDRLDTKGLTRRDICTEDGRGVYAVVTDRGEAVLRDANGPLAERIRRLLDQAPTTDPMPDPAHIGRIMTALGDLLNRATD